MPNIYNITSQCRCSHNDSTQNILYIAEFDVNDPMTGSASFITLSSALEWIKKKQREEREECRNTLLKRVLKVFKFWGGQ